LIRFLGLAIFAGWVFAAGVADAQRYDPSNNMAWPQTPEIGDNPPPANNRRSPSRAPTDGWPGTDAPQPGIPPRLSEDAPEPAARTQPAQSSQGSTPSSQSAQEPPQQTQQRAPSRSERTDAIGRPEPANVMTANPALPPMPHRNMAPAMQARTTIVEAPPAAIATATEQPSPPPPAVAAQPEPAPAMAQPEPAPAPAVVEAPTPQPVAPATAAEPVETAAPAAPPIPAPPAETQAAAAPAPETVAPAISAAPVSEPAAPVQPEPAPAEIAAIPVAPAEPSASPAPPASSETPAAAVPAQPVAGEVPAMALAEPAAQKTPAEKAPPAEIPQQVAAAPAETPAEPALATPAAPSQPQQPAPASQAKVDDALAKWIGQMIVVGFEGTEPDDAGVKAVVDQLRKGRIGGVVVTSRNIRSARQLKALTAALRDAEGVLPLLMIAHEGGAGQAMTPEKGFSAYPSAAALGRANDPLNAFSVYQYMAEELAGYGFNVNLGPVVDLDPATEIDEAAVEGRAYGVVPKHVAAFAKAFRLAHYQKNILTALKHFPPQAAGAAPADVEAADADPLNTFRELIGSDNADMVMISNLPPVGATGEGALPATLAEGLIKTQLREQLGYDGVVLSGDLQAAELAGRWGLEERVTRAVAAGNDMLLAGMDTPPSPDLAGVMAAAIANAVEKDTLARETLEAATNRIARLKASIGNSANAVASADGKSQEKPASR
jgi:beta-N-acetylhexosaminidase